MRIAARALIMKDNRLLLVNAYADRRLDLWCAPGGGVEKHQSLVENLAREIYEETGLTITVGAPAMINEFHLPDRNFHQIDLFFRCTIEKGELDPDWRDPEGVVNQSRFFSRSEMAKIRFKPDSLIKAAWGNEPIYDPLETLIR